MGGKFLCENRSGPPSWINVKNHDIRIWFVTHDFQMRRIADRFGKPLRMHVVFVQPLYVML
jgi:hypothetical protein